MSQIKVVPAPNLNWNTVPAYYCTFFNAIFIKLYVWYIGSQNHYSTNYDKLHSIPVLMPSLGIN